jgi:hypothetical protein
MATANRCGNQRADEENPHTVLLREAEFRPQFLLGDNVRADRQSDVRRR